MSESSVPLRTSAVQQLVSSTCLNLSVFVPRYIPNPFLPNYPLMIMFGNVTWTRFLDAESPLARHEALRTVRQLHLYRDDTLPPLIRPIFERLVDHALTDVWIVLHRIQGFIHLGELLTNCPHLHTIYIELLDNTGKIFNK